MKLACVISSVSRKAGGLHESVRRLAQSLAEQPAADVRVLGLRDEYTSRDLHSWTPLAPSAFPSLGPQQFGYAPQLGRALREMDFDLMLNHGLWMYPSVAGLGWHRRTRRPYIVNPHGMLDAWAVRNSRWKKRIAGWLYEGSFLKNAFCLRALCKAEAGAIRQYGLRNPICIIPNGIDLPVGSVTIPPPWQAIIRPDKRVLLYLGRLHPKKGLPNLLRAWAEVCGNSSSPANQEQSRSRNWELAIAGWDQGGHQSQLQQLASELGTRVRFLGPQFGEKKAASYQHASAVILPSFSEGLPMTVLEAWAHGRPVLMTPACNLPEGFQAESAIRIETHVSDIASGLRTLFARSAAELEAMGKRGRGLVAERFTWDRIGQQMWSVCQWVTGRAEQPACVCRDEEFLSMEA